MQDTLPDRPESAPPKPSLARRLRALALARKINPLLWALLVQCTLLLATVWILVFRAPQQEVIFLPVDTTEVSARPLQTQTLLAQMARATSQSTLPATAIQEAAMPLPQADALNAPSLTDAAAFAFSPFTGNSPHMPHTAGTAETGSTVDSITAMLGGQQQIHFFGIEEQAERYIILLDTSNSMFVRSRAGERYRYDFSQIKDETARLLESFNANTLFNIIVYEGGAWAWQEQMQAASQPVRERAQTWVRNLGENPSLSIRDRRGEGPLLQEGGGTRLDTALRLAFTHYDPQAVFIVTDGEINSIPGGRITEEAIVGLIRTLQAQQAEPARIHVIHYKTAQMREVELQTLRAIARQGRGRFTEISAKQAPP